MKNRSLKHAYKTLLLSAIACASLGAWASTPQSVNVIKFKDANTLFVGDSQSATLYAYSIRPQNNPSASKGYNLHDISTQLARFSNVTPSDIIVRDMAINPASKEAYIAFDSKTSKGYVSHIVTMNQEGNIKAFDLINEAHTEVKINDAPTSKEVFWGKTPMRSLTFTDIDFYDGKVYISGMSNAEFSSALRMVNYPFDGSKTSTSSVEIFHGVHSQNETRAPIQTLAFVTLNNQPYVLAAYTCTPLVLIPVKELKDGAHVVGKTIAEMGYGNTPIDMIKFKSVGMDKKPYEGIILSNRNRTAQFINMTDIVNSANKPSISGVGMVESAGTPFSNLPMTGLLQLDDQDDYHITALRRNDETGHLELISFLKNAYLRLDEFVSEYDQPSYKYTGDQVPMKEMQNMLINDIGQTEYLKK